MRTTAFSRLLTCALFPARSVQVRTLRDYSRRMPTTNHCRLESFSRIAFGWASLLLFRIAMCPQASDFLPVEEQRCGDSLLTRPGRSDTFRFVPQGQPTVLTSQFQSAAISFLSSTQSC